MFLDIKEDLQKIVTDQSLTSLLIIVTDGAKTSATILPPYQNSHYRCPTWCLESPSLRIRSCGE